MFRAVGLGDVDTTYGLRLVTLGTQFLVEFIHETSGAILRVNDLVNRHAIDPRGTAVAAHLHPGSDLLTWSFPRAVSWANAIHGA